MLAKLAASRVNFLIVFFGAPFIIFLIKLTPLLLPPKYYFNFSKLIAYGAEPFIVDPPGITGKKLCELMSEHHISQKSFNRLISCTSNFEDSETKSADRPAFSREEVDEIYTLALHTDAAARSAIVEAAKRAKIEPLTDDEVRRFAIQEKSTSAIFEQIYDHYSTQVSSLIGAGPRDSISRLYSSKEATSDSEDGDHDVGIDLPALSEEVITRAIQANRELRYQLTSELFLKQLVPIKKSSIDKILATLRSKVELGFEIEKYYEDSMKIGLRDIIAQAFATQQIAVGGKDRDRQIVFAEINKFSYTNYVVSILVRLAPVFLFGLFMGAIAGRAEIFSISLAGGLSAFLLSWPLMLMWDRLVSSSWADKKNIFLIFYAVYILSFFLTARSGAVLTAWFRERIGLTRLPEPVQERVESTVRITWREVAVNIAGAGVINCLVYAWNVILPLSIPSVPGN